MTLLHKFRLSFNAPVVLSFALACLFILLGDKLTAGFLTQHFFSVYRSSLLDPLTYVRFVGHVLGHANWQHLFNNMMLFLVIGPILEEKYGSANLFWVIVITALVTGIINFALLPQTQLLGASGVDFALILLASMTGLKEGEIPLTFVLVALIYLGQQVFDGLFVQDNVSNFTHIIGGLVGSALGYSLNKNKINHY
ncbi:rhomboid family intramembrane serine protease [Vaginisenegalia massiliensis]|uniref:rhomboid family intramembrane serine protease n=1 Tax=Vaginisenegalia massiliensis TaxID=2058294 RepID=UPI0019CFB4C0|nr:rhomboid family intramembrane serine protease [Vaginisenegalia massiliensis]